MTSPLTATVRIVIFEGGAMPFYPRLFTTKARTVHEQHVRPLGIEYRFTDGHVFRTSSIKRFWRRANTITFRLAIHSRGDKRRVRKLYREHYANFPRTKIRIAVS